MKQVDEFISDLRLETYDVYKRPFGIKNSYAIAIFFGFLYILNIMGIARPFALMAFGFIYPAQRTAQVYFNNKQGNVNQWLAYWMIAAFMFLFDEYLVYIPLFTTAQPLMLYYLWSPRYNYAENIMNKLIGLSVLKSDALKGIEMRTSDKFAAVKAIAKLFNLDKME